MDLATLICFYRHLLHIYNASDVQKGIIDEFTLGDMRLMELNDYLRHPKNPTLLINYACMFQSVEGAAAYRYNLTELILNAPKLSCMHESIITVYRGFGDFIPPEDDWDLLPLSSTSLSSEIAISFSFDAEAAVSIEIPTTESCLYVAGLSQHLKEREIILPPGRMSFTGRNKNGMKRYRFKSGPLYDKTMFMDDLVRIAQPVMEWIRLKQMIASERKQMRFEDNLSRMRMFDENFKVGALVFVSAGHDDNTPSYFDATLEVHNISIEGSFSGVLIDCNQPEFIGRSSRIILNSLIEVDGIPDAYEVLGFPEIKAR